jgi:hypothetical protein
MGKVIKEIMSKGLNVDGSVVKEILENKLKPNS